MSGALKLLRKQLKSKYSISLSKEIIDQFIVVTNQRRGENQFGEIDKEIKNTAQEIHRKKYFLDKQKMREKKRIKTGQTDKRKRRNIVNVSAMPHLKSHKNLEEYYIKEKLFILKEFVSQEEMERIEQFLIKRLEGVDRGQYGKHTDKIKRYTVYDYIIQKIFSLIQDDSKNMIIREKYQKVYKKMKE